MSADFFSAAQGGAVESPTVADHSTLAFAAAINTLPTIALSVPPPSTSAVSPISSVLSSPVIPLGGARNLPQSMDAASSTGYSAISPRELAAGLSRDSEMLIIDLRPCTQYLYSRVVNAINLAVPSTLIRRPRFSIESLSQMIPNTQDRARFMAWPRASSVVVYDADSPLPSTNIKGLLDKLVAENNNKVPLEYVPGGFQAIMAANLASLLELAPKDDLGTMDQTSTNSSNLISVGSLSRGAFQQSSTTIAGRRAEDGNNNDYTSNGAPGPSTSRVTAANPFYDNIRQHVELSSGITERIPLYLPTKILARKDELPFNWLKDIIRWAGGSTPPPTANIQAIPKCTSTERGRMSKSNSSVASRTGSSTKSGRKTSSSKALWVAASAEEGMEALAMQFYRIELGEQRRLMGVMRHHSQESNNDARARNNAYGINISAGEFEAKTASLAKVLEVKDDPLYDKDQSNLEYFPYSITAGIEKGSKNRYRNIWPFDHARVRLQTATDDGSDYVNASYIQPKGTRKRYIATQGPLPSTYTDFWTLCWEQNVRVIVMLTKCVEGNSVKCGHYWGESKYGPLRLELVKQEGDKDSESDATDSSISGPIGFDFLVPRSSVEAEVERKRARRAKRAMARELGGADDPFNTDSGHEEYSSSSSSDSSSGHIIRRTFKLSNANHPEKPARTVVQLQYIGWPDLNVPPSTTNVLKLINEVDGLVTEYDNTGEIRVDSVGGRDGASRFKTTSAFRSEQVRQTRMDMAGNDGQEDGSNPKTKRHVSPVLVHCSAGVGRTGSYVAADAILDAIRREMKAEREKTREGIMVDNGGHAMDIRGGVQSHQPQPQYPQLSSSNLGNPSESALKGVLFGGLEGKSESGYGNVSAWAARNTTADPSGDPSKPAHSQFTSTLGSEVSEPQPSSLGGGASQLSDRIKQLPMSIPLPKPTPFDDITSFSQVKSPYVPPPNIGASFGSLNPTAASSTTSLTSTTGSSSALMPGISSLSVTSGPPTSVSPPKSFSPSPHDAARSMQPSINPTPFTSLNRGLQVSTTPLSLSTPGDGEGSKKGMTALQRRRASALGETTTLSSRFSGDFSQDLQIGSSITSAGEESAISLGSRSPSPPRADASAFDFQRPRSLKIPKHSRKFHHQLGKVAPGKSKLSNEIKATSVSIPTVAEEDETADPLEVGFNSDKPGGQEDKVITDSSGSGDESEGIPSPLSLLEEPVRQVLEDMREQRMSMCQSLRQYVFVHRVIIEGALALVDQEKESLQKESLQRERESMEGINISTTPLDRASPVWEERKFATRGIITEPMDVDVKQTEPASPPSKSTTTKDHSIPPYSSSPPNSSSSSRHLAPPSSLSPLTFIGGSSASLAGNKRMASPTELLRTDSRGSARIGKRPSLKRINKSYEDTVMGRADQSD